VTVAAAPSNPAGSPAPAGPPGAAPGPVGDPHAAAPGRVTGGEACPLCGAPLSPDQDWCLSCGAAARTRLAATPNWKAPIASLAVVAALALGVLAAALVKLAGDSDSTAAPATTTITTAATTASAPVAPTAAAPGASTATTPSTAVPGAATPTTSVPGAATPGTPTAGATNPGASGSSTAGGSAAPQTDTTKQKSIPALTPAQRELLRKLGAPAARK
jgi:hypothetical protein